ncbi:hypothetical protein BsWGS_27219 [Bradybaena similaris]
MESYSPLPSNVNLEPACEVDSDQSSAREVISEIQDFDRVVTNIPASVKIEQPEANVDYPGEEIHSSSLSCPSLQEQSQLDKKMVFANIDWKPVKHELSDILCDDRSNKFSELVGMASCCNIQEMTEHCKTESSMPENTALVHHEVSLIGTENGYTESQHEDCSHMSESVSSTIETNTKISLRNNFFHLVNAETPVKHTQISGKSLDYAVGYTSCGPQGIQTRNAPYTSDVCNVTISVDASLHRHKTTDTEEKLYKQDIGAASFATAAYQKNHHMKTRTGDKPYKCNICAASFATDSSRRICMGTHPREKPYKCDMCGASFTSTNAVKYHLKKHTAYKCDICDNFFTTSNYLKNHMRIHTGEKPYMCYVCAASFTSALGLKQHKRIHTGQTPYTCNVCDASFILLRSLKHHMRIIHTGYKPYKCNDCAASFIDSHHLRSHMRIIHTGYKPYKCNGCAASFAIARSLKRHKRLHRGETPYTCDICDASFITLQSLKYHMRIIHTGYKPYKCNGCAASFISTCHLFSHMRKIHPGYKPYKCEVCAASFTTGNDLKQHMRSLIHERNLTSRMLASFSTAAHLKNAT